MSNLTINGTFTINGQGIMNGEPIAIQDNVTVVLRTVDQLGVKNGTGTISITPITSYRFIWVINMNNDEWRVPHVFPVTWLQNHYGEELLCESWDGSRYRLQFNSASSVQIVATYYAHDIYIYGVR